MIPSKVVERGRRIFVAQPFDLPSQKLFDQIVAPALFAECLEPVHCRLCENKFVVESVFATIAQCSAVLAVLAGRNQNVFIETGIAIALQKPLVLLVRTKQDAGMLVEKFPVILLTEPEKLKSELRLLAGKIYGQIKSTA